MGTPGSPERQATQTYGEQLSREIALKQGPLYERWINGMWKGVVAASPPLPVTSDTVTEESVTENR